MVEELVVYSSYEYLESLGLSMICKASYFAHAWVDIVHLPHIYVFVVSCQIYDNATKGMLKIDLKTALSKILWDISCRIWPCSSILRVQASLRTH